MSEAISVESSEQQYHQKVDLLVNTIQKLSLARDMETIMRLIREETRLLTGADGVTFLSKQEDAVYCVDENAIGPLWKGRYFPIDKGVGGWVMTHKEPAIIEDVYDDERVIIENYKNTFVKSMVMVPIRRMDPIGALGNYWEKKHKPTADEIQMLQALADITAVSIENVTVYKELEQRVKERTAKLEELNHDLEAFSYSVSHDLQAPLRSMQGFINLLRMGHESQLDKDGNELLDLVDVGAKDMSQLIEGLLSFFRTARQDLEKTEVNMAEVVEEVCKKQEEYYKPQSIEFKVNELPDVEADDRLMKHVWTNLISNAIKYSSKKEKSIVEIGCEEQEDGLIYYVKDNGAGFDMRYADNLFGVFQRLHLKRDFEGTGVGLAIVHKVIGKHDGKVWAEAKVGEGAIFYFSLPR